MEDDFRDKLMRAVSAVMLDLTLCYLRSEHECCLTYVLPNLVKYTYRNSDNLI